MYYTTSGSYKKTKMIIDYTNIVLTVAATVIFIIVLFLRSRSGILFPIEFLLGTIVNALTSQNPTGAVCMSCRLRSRTAGLPKSCCRAGAQQANL